MSPRAWLHGLALLVALHAACGPARPTKDPLPDAAPPLPDATQESDAWAEEVVAVIKPEEVGRTEPCEDATLLSMGPEGIYETLQQTIHDDLLTYHVSYRGRPGDVFLYDLLACTEYLISPLNEREDSGPSIRDGKVVYSASLPPEEQVVSGSQIMELDLVTFELRRLSPFASGRRTRHNGRHVLFIQFDKDGFDELILHDRWTDTQRVLAERWQGSESHRINEHYAVWIASVGGTKIPHYLDLATGDVVEVTSTIGHAVYDTDLWGDLMLWTDLRTGRGAIHGLRISTGEEVQLTDDENVHSQPAINGHLVAWRTRPANSWAYQIVVHDMVTGVRRVVVSEPSSKWKVSAFDGDWLIFLYETSFYWGNQIYAMNLRRAGFLGPDQHLIPGEDE